MSNFNKLIKGAGVFLLYILVPYIIDMFLPSMTLSNNKELIIRFIFMFLLLLFFVFLYKDDIIKDIKALKDNKFKLLKDSLVTSAIIIVTFLVTGAIIMAIHPTFQYTNDSILKTLLEDNIFLMIIYVFIISLLTEQIVFRKVFRDIIQNKYFFVIFSGLIYGIFVVGYNVSSLNDILTIIPYTLVGIILSSSYEKTDNIMTPCLAYLFYDLFILLMNI